MKVGIYALYWWDQDLIYIGQSQDIDRRYKEHLSTLKSKKHTNYKVQDAYNKYGIPKLEIVEYCSLQQLNELEIQWTLEFNSLNTIQGLNIIEAGTVGYGTASNGSKYTKLQILMVFRAISTYNHPLYKDIAKNIGVNASLLKDIKCGKSHLWLKEAYPFRYSRMLNVNANSNSKSLYNSLGKVVKVLNTNNNTVYTIHNIREFAKQHNLANTHLGEVIRGNRKSHKGWKLA